MCGKPGKPWENVKGMDEVLRNCIVDKDQSLIGTGTGKVFFQVRFTSVSEPTAWCETSNCSFFLLDNSSLSLLPTETSYPSLLQYYIRDALMIDIQGSRMLHSWCSSIRASMAHQTSVSVYVSTISSFPHCPHQDQTVLHRKTGYVHDVCVCVESSISRKYCTDTILSICKDS